MDARGPEEGDFLCPTPVLHEPALHPTFLRSPLVPEKTRQTRQIDSKPVIGLGNSLSGFDFLPDKHLACAAF